MSTHSLFGRLMTRAFRPRPQRTIRRRPSRLRLEALEDRVTPATFTDAAPTLTLALAANETVSIVANATTYTLTLTSGLWNGTNGANVTGNGTATLTAQKAPFTQVNLTDTGANTSVTFNNSGAEVYTANLSVQLTAAAAGNINLNGNILTDGGNVSLTGNVVVTAAAVTIDTEDGNNGNAGAVSFAGLIFADAAGRNLVINTDTSNVGSSNGTVTLAAFGNGGGAFVNNVTIDADDAATTGATVTIPAVSQIAGTLAITAGPIASNARFAAGAATAISLTSDANITDGNGASANFVAQSLTASSATGIDLDTTIATLTSASVSAGGDINISDTAGGLTVTSATTSATGGNITLEATGGNLTLTTVTAGGSGDIVAITPTSGDILVGNVTATSDTITLVSGSGAIEESGADAGTDVSAATIELTAATGIGAVAQIEIDANTAVGQGLTADVGLAGNINLRDADAVRVNAVISNGGSITLGAGGNMTLGSVATVGNSVTIDATGAITDGDAGATNNITADEALLIGLTGIGASGDPIETDVDTLDFDNTSNGVFVTNSGGLTLSNLGSTAPARAAGGAITATSPLVVAMNTTVTGAMTFTAGNSGSAGDDLTISSGVTVTIGATVTVNFNAGDDIVFGSGATINDGAFASTVNLNAHQEGANGDGDDGGVTQSGVGTSVAVDNLNILGPQEIGQSATPLRIDAVNITTDSSALNGGQFLHEVNTVTIAAAGLSAGAGGITLVNGTWSLGGSNRINDSTDLTVASPAIFNLASFSDTIDALAGNGTIQNSVAASTSTLTVGSNGGSANFSGVLQDGTGTLALTKIGAGTQTLSGANTYTGTTTVSAGVLRIQNATALGGTTSGTTVSSGAALQIDGDPTTVGGSLTIAAEPLTLNGSGVSSTGALRNLTGNNTWTGTVTLQIDSSIGVDSSTQLTINGNVRDPTPAVIPAPGLTKVGAGTLIFPNANTYNGTTTINNGRLNIRNAAALGVSGSAGTVVNSGGTLQVQAGINVLAEPLTLNGSGFGNAGALENLSENNTWSNTVTLGSQASIGVDSGIDSLSMTGAISDGGSAFGLTKIGPGTLEYAGSAANTCSGTTQVNQGTLELNKSGGATAIAGSLTIGDTQTGPAFARWLQSNQVADTSAVTVNSDGSADLDFRSETIGALSINGGLVNAGTLTPPGNNVQTGGSLTVSSLSMQGGTVLLDPTGSALTLQGDVTAASSAAGGASIQGTFGVLSLGGATRTFTVNAGPQPVDLTIAVPIVDGSGSAGLTKAGPGLLELNSNTNTYSGTTTVNSGTLSLDTTGGNAIRGPLVIGDNLGGNNADVVVWQQSNQVIDNAPVTVNASGLLNLNGQSDHLASLSLQTGLAATTGAATITTGAGTLTLVNFVNVTNFNAATDDTGADVNGLVSLTFGTPFTVADAANAPVDLEVTAGIGGIGGINKSGPGTMRLIAGTNTFTGNVNINGGTLLIDTVVGAGLSVTVNAGRTLGGTRNQTVTPVGGVVGPTLTSGQLGTVTGTQTRGLVLSGGTLSVGDPNVNGGVGQFTVFGNVANTAGSASTHVYQLNGGGGGPPVAGTDYDQLVVNGVVALSNATLSLSGGYVPVTGDSFVLINNDGTDTVTGTFAGLAEGSLVTFNGVPLSITYTGGSGNNDVQLTRIQPTVVYVDNDWTGTAPSTNPANDPVGGLVFGSNAFADIQSAVNVVADNGTVVVFGGTYSMPAALTINKPLAAIDVSTNTTIPGDTTVLLNEAVTLANSVIFVETGVAGGTAANLTFGSTVNALTAGGAGLTVNGSMTLTFAGAVGGTAALASLTTDAGGSTVLNGGSVTATGAQTYNDAVTLSANNTLTITGSGVVAFNSTVDDVTLNTHDLTVTGNASFNGVVGGLTAPHGLHVTGTSAINTTAVTTGGNQAYDGAVTLGSDTTLKGANLTFGSTLTGASRALTLTATGNVAVTGAVGTLSTLTVTTAVNATFNTTVTTVGNVTQSAGTGTTTFSGGNVGGALAVTTKAITLSSATLTTVDAVNLNAQDAVTFSATLDAGGSTVTIAANQDGAGTQGFSQTAGQIVTSDATAAAIAITVNTGAGGTGNAALQALLAGGTVTINARGGSITENSVDATAEVTAPTALLTGNLGINLDLNAGFVTATTNNNAINLRALSPAVVNGLTAGTGTITLGAGTFQSGAAEVISDASAVVLGATATLDLNNFTETIGSLAGGGLTGGNVTLGSATLTTGGDGTSTTFAGSISGGGNLVKTGAGTLTLQGANAYTGATTVNGGTLLVNNPGSTAAGSAVTVNNNGTLGGTGTVNGSVTVASGGTLAPGTSPGILRTGNLTLGSGATFAVEANSPYTAAGGDYDQANVTGSVTLNGAILSLAGGAVAPTTSKVLTIINNDGSADPVMGTIPFLRSSAAGNPPLPEGATVMLGTVPMRLSYQGGDGNDVTLSVAPPQITSANATAFTSGVFGSFTVIATGAPTPALTQTGALPAGVSFVDNGNGTATLSGTPAPSSVGVYPLTLRATNGIGSGFTQAFTLTVQAPPGIANLQLGPVVAGFANQRSRIDSIVVTFSESLSIHPDSAFSLTRTTNSTAVALTVTYNADFSRATLTFSGPNVSGGSLIDGRYRLTVDGSQLITAGGVAIDADGDRAPGGTLTVDFHRLFGDSDGDADTDFTDLARFRLALGGPSTTPLIVYNPVFDSDGDGDVDFTDLAQFRLRLGTVLP